MPDWIDEAAKAIAETPFAIDTSGIANIIREAYQNRPQEIVPLPEDLVPSGPEGIAGPATGLYLLDSKHIHCLPGGPPNV